MPKKIFIITSHDSDCEPNKIAEIAQTLQEYDYDVVNPLIIEEHEKRRVELGLLDDNYGWMKRDIQKLIQCDGVVVKETYSSSDYEWDLVKIAQLMPWISIKNVKYLDEWIAKSGD